jgi:hypothetical protein
MFVSFINELTMITKKKIKKMSISHFLNKGKIYLDILKLFMLIKK